MENLIYLLSSTFLSSSFQCVQVSIPMLFQKLLCFYVSEFTEVINSCCFLFPRMINRMIKLQFHLFHPSLFIQLSTLITPSLLVVFNFFLLFLMSKFTTKNVSSYFVSFKRFDLTSFSFHFFISNNLSSVLVCKSFIVRLIFCYNSI